MSLELLEAIREGDDLEEITALLNIEGTDVDFQDDNNTTALHEAVLSLDIPIITLLLNRKADVNLEDSSGNTALNLLYVDYVGNNEADLLPVLRLLQRAGADLDHPDSHDDTFIKWAAYNGHEAIVKLLLDADVSGHSALTEAREGHHQNIIALIHSYPDDATSSEEESDNSSNYSL